MARLAIYVLSDGGSWKIKQNDKETRGFRTQRDAIRAAVDEAHRAGQHGQDSQVLIQGENGQWRTEWTYGHDPYPPKG